MREALRKLLIYASTFSGRVIFDASEYEGNLRVRTRYSIRQNKERKWVRRPRELKDSPLQ